MPFSVPNDPKTLAKLVERRHPAYADRLPHWVFCQSTYEGGPDWFKQNMHRYIKEGAREFKERVKRAYRVNHTREVVKLITKYVFKEGVIRNRVNAPQYLKDFWDFTTLEGENIDALMENVSDVSSVNGVAWVFIDNNVPGDSMSKADVKSAGSRTYAYIMNPKDVLDFAYDDLGKLLWVLYQFPYRNDANPFTDDGSVDQRYMLWTREGWAIFGPAKGQPGAQTSITVQGKTTRSISQQVVLISSGQNSIGEVPAVRVPHARGKSVYDTIGLVDDTAYLDQAIANYLSNLDAVIQDQTFSQLVMPADGLTSGGDEADVTKKLTELGTRRIFTYDSNSSTGPQYISPDASQAQIIMTVIKMIITEIYNSVGMAGERTVQDNGLGTDSSSGVAKAYDFDRMNALLCSKASKLEDAENDIARIVGLWNGEKTSEVVAPEDSLIKYPDTYDVRGLPDEFQIAQNLLIVEAPDTIRRQQMTVMIDKLFPRLAKNLKAQMIAELKDWPIDPVQAAQEMMKITGTTATGGVKGAITSQGSGVTTPTPGAQGAQNPAQGGAQTTPKTPERPTTASTVKGQQSPQKSKQGQNNN